MAIVRYTPDPDHPFQLTPEQRARLDAMTDEELTANALSDPDNPPLTDEELDRGLAGRSVRIAREKTGLSQPAFAKAFRINLARVRDLEQGRHQPDSALLAYLGLIEQDPEWVLSHLSSVKSAA